MGQKSCTQSVNTSREVIGEIEVRDINVTTKQFVKNESAETLTAYKHKKPESSDQVNRLQN